MIKTFFPLKAMKNPSSLLFALLLTVSTFAQENLSVPAVDMVYEKQLSNWQRTVGTWQLRNFVPLVGLHRLKEGKNTFGKHPDNDIMIESTNVPDFIGTIFKEGEKVQYRAADGLTVMLEKDTITEITYTFDDDRNSEKLQHKFTKWYVQYVGFDYYLRVMDEIHPATRMFVPNAFYPANEDFIFMARYKPYKKVKYLELNNVISTSIVYEAQGEVIFEYRGKSYQLVLLKGNFLMYGDETNGNTTFPIGRYIRVGKPNDDNLVVLDFNYSFNPPRAVSLYTTCEIAPDINRLPFKVEAGELYEGDGQPIIREID